MSEDNDYSDKHLKEVARKVINTPDPNVETVKKGKKQKIQTPLTKAVRDIVKEYKRASKKFPPFNSQHEGYAVLKEEVDELWDEIKKKEISDTLIMDKDIRWTSKERKRAEAVQCAAMCLRFLVDVTS